VLSGACIPPPTVTTFCFPARKRRPARGIPAGRNAGRFPRRAERVARRGTAGGRPDPRAVVRAGRGCARIPEWHWCAQVYVLSAEHSVIAVNT